MNRTLSKEKNLLSQLLDTIEEHPWLFAGILFIAVRVCLGLLFDLEPRCESGWKSPSIGRQGACSHHGGVVKPGIGASLFSILVAASTFLVSSSRKRKREEVRQEALLNEMQSDEERKSARKVRELELKSPNSGDLILAPDSVPPCPVHGRMHLSNDGTRWTCKEFPECQYYFERRGD